MRYCIHCGAQLDNNARFCRNCGAKIENNTYPDDEFIDFDDDYNQPTQKLSTMALLSKIFMIIGCVISASGFFIPLIWTIPMTVIYCKKLDRKEPIGEAFKICSLLFVSLIAGILMLVDDDPYLDRKKRNY